MFNNAGVTGSVPGMAFEDHTADDFERLTAINFRGVFHGCKHAVKQFKAAGRRRRHRQHGFDRGDGRLRQRGLRRDEGGGEPDHARRRDRMRALRHPVQRDLPRSDATHELHVQPPGAGVPTAPDEFLDMVASLQPLGRYITAEDCAAAAVFLASDEAANLTGVLLPIDGGYVAW